LTSQFILIVTVNQNEITKERSMTRLFKSFISTLVMFSLVAVLPAESTVKADQVEFAVELDSDNVFASADVKKKKKKGKKLSEKGKKKKKGFFSKVFGSK
tara:strand:+ start:85 stop:384 length:300 start_codon:yes stop_codon:yes gene_type:complete